MGLKFLNYEKKREITAAKIILFFHTEKKESIQAFVYLSGIHHQDNDVCEDSLIHYCRLFLSFDEKEHFFFFCFL
jgi:hypothetical protein